MSTTPHVSVSRTIAADADALWSMVSDITRMGEWSPENVAGKWVKGASGPELGARFKGSNRNGARRWSTMNTVNECEPGRRFGFQTSVGPMKAAQWTFTFARADGGTEVTQEWTDQRSGVLKAVGALATGVSDRDTHNRAGMEATLAALDDAVS